MVPERTFLWPIILSTLLLNRESTIKIDKSRESTDLNYEKGQFRYSYGSKFWKVDLCTSFHCDFTKTFYFIFALFTNGPTPTRGWKSKHQVEPSRKATLSLSILTSAFTKISEKCYVQLYYIKMKICHGPCFIDIGVAMVTQWRHFLFNLPLYFLVPGVFSESVTVQFLIRRGRWIKAPKTYLCRVSLESVGEQGWRGGESTRLPPTMWPGFKSQRRLQTWVEFVVGSLLCSERFFSGYSGFPLSLKTNTSKFQFDLERTDTFTRVQWTPKCFVGKQITIYNLYYN